MRRWLCTVELIPDRPDIVWAALPIDPNAVNPSPINRKVVGDGVQCYSLDGEEVPGHRKGVDILSTVGSFETSAELIAIITPVLVEKAKIRLDRETSYMPLDHAIAVGKEIRKYPTYENAVWILKATPEELRAWADSLSQRT
jgi:hypothetical protein